MREKIITLVAEYLDIERSELDETRTLADLRIDSLDFVEIMFEIEEAFDTSLTTEMQDRSGEMHSFGDVLRIAEELIRQQRAPEAAGHAD